MLMVILFAWATVALIMGFAWLLYLYKKNPGIVDVAWSICIMSAGFIYLSQNESSIVAVVTAILLSLWALRLAIFLLVTRVLPHHIEERYEDLSTGWKMPKKLGFLLNYQLQALLGLVVASPCLWISTDVVHFTSIQIVSMVVIMLGIIGEAITDQQLYRFKQAMPGSICQLGLWRYSRHPNYFCEWLIWCGFTGIALANQYGYFAVVSPILIYVIVNHMTGPVTERVSVKHRGDDYQQYIRTTNQFFPGPKKVLSQHKSQ